MEIVESKTLDSTIAIFIYENALVLKVAKFRGHGVSATAVGAHLFQSEGSVRTASARGAAPHTAAYGCDFRQSGERSGLGTEPGSGPAKQHSARRQRPGVQT